MKLTGKATEKQKNFLDELEISYDEDISKQDASDLIEEHLNELNSHAFDIY